MAPKSRRRLFGVDGIRGIANVELTPAVALGIGLAAGVACKRGNHRHRVVIGKDPRLSGYVLEPALVAGFTSAGMDVLLTGPNPTPGVAMLVRSMRADLGVMISASREPYERNGLKLFGPDGLKLSAKMEREIERLIASDFSRKLADSSGLGRARRIDGVQDRYIEYAKGTVPKGLQLDGIRVIVDCANGAAYQVAPQVLEELGAEVFAINVEPDGFNINRECGVAEPRVLQSKVHHYRADFGFALDGDADCVVVCDENGRVIESEHLEAAFPDWQGDGLVLALQVLALMRTEGKSASDICSRFAA